MTTPFLPKSKDCHGEEKAKILWPGVGCGSEQPDEGAERHLFGCSTKGKDVVWNCKQQFCCGFGCFFLIYFVFFGIIQWIMFHWATENCSSLPDKYDFPGGGNGHPAHQNATGPEDNLLPRNSLIVAREPSLYGEAFDVFNSTKEGQMVSAPVGTWFRTWGPWFYTYTYQDTLNSKATVYMRPSMVGITGAIREVVVHRCDGKGKSVKFSEGSKVLTNMYRDFFRLNTGMEMVILVDGERTAIVEETFHGQKSATFKTYGNKPQAIGSSILRGVNGQGFNEWFLHNAPDSPLPFYMTGSIAANYAFKIHNEKSGPTVPATFLMEQNNLKEQLATPAPKSKDAERV
jgi:hypothetical protein